MVIGAGIVALATSWLLQGRGHRVRLIAPDAHGPDPQDCGNGSAAALGVLMAQVFQRSRGRAWHLRQASLSLWTQWRQQLSGRGWPIPFQAGLLLLPHDIGDTKRLRQLLEERQALGLPLSWWEPSRLQELGLSLVETETNAGGLHSAQDGQLDPLAAMDAFRRDGLRQGLELLSERVVGLERQPAGWRVQGCSGAQAITADWVVLAAGLASEGLLAPSGTSDRCSPCSASAWSWRPARRSAGPAQWSGRGSTWCLGQAGVSGWGRPWSRGIRPTRSCWDRCDSSPAGSWAATG